MNLIEVENLLRKIKGRASGFEIKVGRLYIKGGFRCTGEGESKSEKVEVKTEEENLTEVVAQRVGYFMYLRDRRGEVLVKPGSKISKGDPVGLIVAMGVETRVVSPVDGVIEEMLVEEGAPVEYGQPLMRIKLQ